MSVVIAIKDKDRIYVGCDSRMSSQEDYYDSYYSRPKAYKLENGLIVAGVGNIGIVDILADVAKGITKLTHDIVVSKIAVPLFNKLSGTVMVNNGELDGSLLVAKDDMCFIISSICTVEEVYNYNAIGSGKSTAMGSLYSTFYMKNPEKRIVEAIKATSASILTVSSEAYVADTKTNDFRKLA